jgi:hypothetical protein
LVLANVKQLRLGGHLDHRGSISVLELPHDLMRGPALPFVVKRIYILHGQDQTQSRGVHAHKALRQVIFAMAGQVEIQLDDGFNRETYHLSSPGEALVIEPVVWRDIVMSPGAVVAVLASEVYDEADYIREYDEFLDYVGQTKS